MTESIPATPPGSSLVPGWLQRLAAYGWRILATIALALVALAILATISTVSISILVAAIVAATFAPFILRLRDRGWSRIKAAAAVFVGAGVVIIAAFVAIALAFVPYASAVVSNITAGLDALRTELANLDLPPEVGMAISAATQDLQAWVSDAMSGIVGDVANLATIGILATFLTFFFMMDGDKAWLWVLSAANAWRRDAITSAGDVALARVGGYLRGTAVLAAIAGLSQGAFLVLLGVPFAGPLAVLVFLGRFIPYLGGLVTTVVLLLVTLATAGSGPALVLLALIAILDVILGKFVAPVVYSRTVHIHPALVLVALPAGAAVAGTIGLFAAIPFVAFVMAIVGSVVDVLGVEPSTEGSDDLLVPLWLDRLGQWSWRLLVVAGLFTVLIAAMIQVPIVVYPVVLGIVVASTLLPLGARFEALGWSHARAALAATLGMVVGVTVIVGLTVVSLIGAASQMTGTGVSGAESANDGLGGALGAGVSLVQAFGSGILVTISSVASALGGLAVILLLSTLLTFYFMRDGDRAWRAFLDRIEPGRRSHVEAAGSRAVGVLGGYMIGTGAISIFGAATQFLIMTILGIPLALPLAILAVFGGFIPYIGSIVTTGLAFLVTVATGTPQDIAIMGVFTIVFNIVQGNFVAPIVYSRVVSLHPAVVLAAIPAGSEIAGVAGMFLVVPFLGVVATVWRTLLVALDPEPVGPTTAGAASDVGAEHPTPAVASG